MTRRNTRLADQVQPDHQILVEWPKVSISNEADDNDLGPPLAQLMADMGIKGTDADEESAEKTSAAYKGIPVSVSIIEAGATAAGKGWATAIAALGGATAVWAAVTDFWNSQQEPTRGTLIIAAAIVVAACALGSALIMYGDIKARGQAAAAQYYARASVASAFLGGATAAARTTADQSLLAEVKAAREQASDVRQDAQQLLKEFEDTQNANITLVLAQARYPGAQASLKGNGSGKREEDH